MIESCKKCNCDFLTEADPYGVIPSSKGYLLFCSTCFAEKTYEPAIIREIQSLKTQLEEAEKVIKSAMRSCSEDCASVRHLPKKCACVAQQARGYFEKYKETK
jgi:hypothetical protein